MSPHTAGGPPCRIWVETPTLEYNGFLEWYSVAAVFGAPIDVPVIVHNDTLAPINTTLHPVWPSHAQLTWSLDVAGCTASIPAGGSCSGHVRGKTTSATAALGSLGVDDRED